PSQGIIDRSVRSPGTGPNRFRGIHPMRKLWLCGVGLAALCLAPPAAAEEPAKAAPVEVPYRLTVPKHILVRATLNAHAPSSSLPAPAPPPSSAPTKVCKTLGVAPARPGWGPFHPFESGGGVLLNKPRPRPDAPPQLEGMNALGLAGCELHGVIGYDV